MAIVRAAGGKGADLDDSSNIHSGDEPSRTAESNLVAELAGHPAGSRSYLWVRVLGLLLIAITVFLCETLRWDHGSVKIWEVTHTTLEPNATLPALRTSNSEFDGISDERATINTLSEMSSFLTDLERIVNGSVLEFLDRKLTDDSVLDGVLHEGAATFVRNGGEALIPEWASNWSGTTNSSRRSNFTWHHYESLVRPFGAFRRLQDKNLHKRRWTWSGVKTGFGRAFGGRRLWMLEFAVCVLLAVGIFANMVPGGFRDAGGYRDAGPRQHAHVGDAGPPFLGTATLKVPPAWSIERAAHYSLRSWISDLILWSSATDLEAHRLGPVAALQVTGSAKELVRELAPDHLANGIHDPQTGQHITGLMLLVSTLATRYAPLDQEASTKAVGEFLNFSKLPNEAVDALLVRFDVLRNRAAQRGGLALNASGMAWILLRALSLPAELLDRLLAQTGGHLPVNEDQLVELMGRIRRQGHLFEQGFKTSFKQGGTGDPGAYFYPTFAGKDGKVLRCNKCNSDQHLWRQLSQVSAASGRNKRRADEMRQGSSCQDRPPAWEPGRPSSWSSQVGPDDSVSQTGSAAAGVQTLIPGASLPKHPPPQNSPPHVSEQERSKATLQLQSLLFAWWESPVDDPKAEAKQAGLCDIYHERTRVHGKVGLLVDPGAHDNLCGSNTMELMADQLGCQVEAKELSRPLNVQGVGKGSQQARVSHSLKFALKADGAEQVSGSFNTPIVPDSDLPPLLGLKSLKRSKAILDTHGQKLIIPGPGGVEMIMSPGSLVFPLEMSDSGHLILPVHASTHDAVSAERTLDFPSSRACASPSGADRNVRRLSSFRPDEVNCAADRAGDAGGGLQ
ncbi:hypothetical protein AK812_SmicGene43651 [Symbiodinium microadriaticum]|uniref:Uncharacterized protein n=1 Tax=Symbiodinium microadriaticum TaxID=2951 RepID=A0A1Q9C0G9_SYMMI|nr:hypothetical protein AK812_SmicGene43651 [Symbiodinium microadriaticum]